MAKTNAERQAAWRVNRQLEIERLTDQLAKLSENYSKMQIQAAWRVNRQLEIERLTDQLAKLSENYSKMQIQAAWRVNRQSEIERLTDQLAKLSENYSKMQILAEHRLTVGVEYAEQIKNLGQYNKGLQTRISNLKTSVEHRDWLLAMDAEDGERLDKEQWDKLAAMDDVQLRQWVAAGRRMADKGHGG